MNSYEYYCGFRCACYNGHLEVIKYLCETFDDKRMNSSYKYYGFKCACENGHLDVVKYLCEKFKDE